MTRAWLEAQLGMLAVLRGAPEDVSGYHEALRDVPQDVLRAALAHGLKTRAFFPTPAEIRVDCDVVAARVRPSGPVPAPRDTGGFTATLVNPFTGSTRELAVDRGWRDDCEHCGDTGTVLAWCADRPSERAPWLPVLTCERRAEHPDHEWAYPCPCVATNPTIRRRRAAAAKYASEPGKVA